MLDGAITYPIYYLKESLNNPLYNFYPIKKGDKSPFSNRTRKKQVLAQT